MRKSAAWPLTWMYIALVVYASLYPFSNWRDQGIAPWSFLWAPVPRYWSGFDVAINLAGYVPLGALLALVTLRAAPRTRLALRAVFLASVLSLLMESLQSYLPQRVASREDWLLNSAGAALGAWMALGLARAGWLARWDVWRHRWLASQSRGVLALLLAWPAALLFPAAVPFGVGQVWQRLAQFLEGLVPGAVQPPVAAIAFLSPNTELWCVTLGLLVPCLLGFCVVHSIRHRLALAMVVLAVGFAATGLSAALSWGPGHLWAWLNPATGAGVVLAQVLLLVLVLVRVPARVSASLALLALGLSVGLLNQAPDSPYFAQTLHAWEQGRFIRFNGFAQWLGWAWPYAAMGVALAHIAWQRQDT